MDDMELHRCANVWLKFGPCWRVQLYPALRFDDDEWFRDESRTMPRTIREGRLRAD